jgi:hypothetical protein
MGAALVGAVLICVLIWDWNRPSTASLAPVASDKTPKASLSLLSPGILSVALESVGGASAAALALQRDGTIVIGGTFLGAPAPGLTNSRGVILRLASNAQLANPAVTMITDEPTGLSGLSTAPDGTIVVFGSSGWPNGHSLLARLLPDGTLDPAFGGRGAVLAKMKASMFSATPHTLLRYRAMARSSRRAAPATLLAPLPKVRTVRQLGSTATVVSIEVSETAGDC